MLKAKKDRKSTSFITELVSLEGKLITNGDLRLEGKVKGTVQSENILIGSSCEILGDVHAVQTTLSGKLTGNISNANFLEITSQSKIAGHIKSSFISIEEGALVDGVIDVLEPKDIGDSLSSDLKKITEPLQKLSTDK